MQGRPGRLPPEQRQRGGVPERGAGRAGVGRHLVEGAVLVLPWLAPPLRLRRFRARVREVPRLQELSPQHPRHGDLRVGVPPRRRSVHG